MNLESCACMYALEEGGGMRKREEMKQRERDGFGFISYIFIVRDLVLAIW